MGEIGTILAKGNTASIYLSDQKIYKLYEKRLPRSEAFKEATKQEIAHANGLQVPKVLGVTMIKGRQALVMEYSDAASFGDLLFEEKIPADELLRKAIHIQRDIHTREVKNIERMNDKLKVQISNAPYLHEKRRSQLIHKLHQLDGPLRLCHGDFHLFNLLNTKPSATIIDWVDASAGNPLADVCRSYLLYLQFSAELASSYMKLYVEISGVQEDSIYQWLSILAAARLTEDVSSDNKEQLIKLAYE